MYKVMKTVLAASMCWHVTGVATSRGPPGGQFSGMLPVSKKRPLLDYVFIDNRTFSGLSKGGHFRVPHGGQFSGILPVSKKRPLLDYAFIDNRTFSGLSKGGDTSGSPRGSIFWDFARL